MINKKENLTKNIVVFLDGKILFSLNDVIDSWKQKEKISFSRNPLFQIEIGDFPSGSPSQSKIIESKVVARIKIKNEQDQDMLCILCYELIEPTRNQIVQDIIKIKQELSCDK